MYFFGFDYIDYRKFHVSSCNITLLFTNFFYYSKAFKSGKRLLIVQCNAGRKHNHLISYARHRVPLLQETVTHLKEPSFYVIFVIHIPRHHIDTTVFGLQGGQWLSAHIDDLRESNIAPYMAMGKHISDLLCDPESLKSGKSLSSSLLYQRLHNCIPAAASRLQKSEEQPSTRSVQRISILLDLIPKSPRGNYMYVCMYIPL